MRSAGVVAPRVQIDKPQQASIGGKREFQMFVAQNASDGSIRQ
jgi:hypothetical protein